MFVLNEHSQMPLTAYVARARIRMEDKQHASAIADLTTAIEIQPNYVAGEVRAYLDRE